MEQLRVLAVCTHNRTRSVVMGGLINDAARQRGLPVAVRTRGVRDAGHPATSRAVDYLAGRGIDVRAHRSRRLRAIDVHRAELVVTAERTHVAEIVGRWPEAFRYTLTLPEFVTLGERTGGLGGDLPTWLADAVPTRPLALDYLDADEIGEIADPTGGSPAQWRSALRQVDDLAGRFTALMATL